MVTASVGCRSVALPFARDLEILAFASSPSPINLFTITVLRIRFTNLTRVVDTSVPISGVDGSVTGDATGEAWDGRPLASPEFRSSSCLSWGLATYSVGDTRPDVGFMVPVLGGIVGLAYGGGIDSMLSVLPVLPELRPNIALIRLSGTDARRTTRALQLRAAFDFSGTVFFTHL